MEQREEKNACVRKQVSDKTLSFEVNGELSLPDYLGEISRLLWVRPTVMPPTRFLGGGNAELSGRICYEALYAGADGRLYSTGLEDTYSFSVPTTAERADMLSVEVYPEVVVGRVAAPRRLTVRCRLHANVCGYEEKSLAASLSREAEEAACRLGEMTACGSFAATVGEAVELYDEIEVAHTGEMRVIASRAEVFLPEAVAEAEAVRCRGEAVVTLLCCPESGEGEEAGESLPYTLVRRLPFATEVPLAGVSSEYVARAMATVSETRAVQEAGKLSVAVRVVPQVEAQCRTVAYYTKDIFMPRCSTECKYSEEKIWLPQLCTNKNYSISDMLTPPELGMPTGAEVIDAVAEAEVREKSTDGKNALLAGEVHCHVLYKQGGEYGVGEATLPFRVSAEGAFDTALAFATVPVVRAQRERDRIRLDAELVLAIRGSSFDTVRVVDEARFSPAERVSRADLELTYPAAGESLWEVSRRHAVSPASIAVANGIDVEDMASPTSLSGVRYLMIPAENE